MCEARSRQLSFALGDDYNSLQLLAAQTPGSNITVISTVIIKIMLCNVNTSRMTIKMKNDHHLQQIKGINNKQNNTCILSFHDLQQMSAQIYSSSLISVHYSGKRARPNIIGVLKMDPEYSVTSLCTI